MGDDTRVCRHLEERRGPERCRGLQHVGVGGRHPHAVAMHATPVENDEVPSPLAPTLPPPQT